MRQWIIIGFLVIFPKWAKTQNVSEDSRVGYFSLQLSEDAWKKIDQYYTGGARVELVLPALRSFPVMHLLPKLKNALNYSGLSITADAFTPIDINSPDIQFGDRPFSAYLHVGFFNLSNQAAQHQKLTTELTLGILGPKTGIGNFQKWAHTKLKSPEPIGWRNQIQTDLVLNYNLRYEKGWINEPFFQLISQSGVRVGTLYDDLHTGIQARLGKLSDYFVGFEQLNKKGNRLECYLSGKIQGTFVLYNATMQGGVFENKSVYTFGSAEVSDVVLREMVSATIRYRKFSLELGHVWISQEFKSGTRHGWYSLNLTGFF